MEGRWVKRQKPESTLGYTARNIAQVPARLGVGAATFLPDIVGQAATELGLPEYRKLNVPPEVEANPFLLPQWLEQNLPQTGQQEPLSQEQRKEFLSRYTDPYKAAWQQEDIYKTLPEYVRPQEGDYLGAGLTMALPFLKVPSAAGALQAVKGLPQALSQEGLRALLPSLPGLARAGKGLAETAFKTGTFYGGSKIGETALGAIGEKLGMPKTFGAIGGIAGGGIAHTLMQKGLTVLKNLPQAYYQKNFIKKTENIRRQIENDHSEAVKAANQKYDEAMKNLEGANLTDAEQVRSAQEQLNNTYSQEMETINQTKDQLDAILEQETARIEGQKAAIPEQAAAHYKKSMDLYNQLENVIRNKYGNSVPVATKGLKEQIQTIIDNETATSSTTTKTQIDGYMAQLMEELEADTMDLQRLRNHMKGLGKIGFEGGATPTASQTARTIRNKVNDFISKKIQNPEVSAMWKEADQNYRQYATLEEENAAFQREMAEEQRKLAAEHKKAVEKQVSRPSEKRKARYKAEQEAITGDSRKEQIRKQEREITETRKQEVAVAKEKRVQAEADLDNMISEGKQRKLNSWMDKIKSSGVTLLVAENIGRLFGASGWLEALIDTGAVGMKEIFDQLQTLSFMKESHPDLYVDYFKGAKEAVKGNVAPYLKTVAAITTASREEPKKEPQGRWAKRIR